MKNTEDNGRIKPPFLSVVMPAYNAAPFIGKAIESVLAQTFEDWELVIVDDGSTDGTADVVRRYMTRCDRIRLLTMPLPSGAVYQPRKFAIVNAVSDFIAPVDADDIIEDGYLQTLVGCQSQTGAEIVYPTMFKFDDENDLRQDMCKNIPGTDGSVFDGSDMVKYTLDIWRIGCGGGLILRKLYLDVFQRYDSSLSFVYADELLTRQLLYHAPRVAFSTAEYYYRQNSASVTHIKSIKQFDKLRNNIHLHDFVASRYGRHSEEMRLMNFQLFRFVYDAARELNSGGYTREDIKSAYELMLRNISLIDWDILKPNVTAKYYYTLKVLKNRLPLLRLVLKAGDRVIES